MREKERKKVRKTIAGAMFMAAIFLTGCSLPQIKKTGEETGAAAQTIHEEEQAQPEKEVIASGEGQIYDDTSLFTQGASRETISPDGIPVLDGDYQLSDYIELCDLGKLVVDVEYDPDPTREDATAHAKFDMDAKPAGDYYEIEKGDIADIDLYAYIDGEEVPELARTGAQVFVGAGGTEKAIEDALVGMIAGSSRRVEITYGDDIEYMDLGGKTVTYNIVVTSVATAGVPEEADVDKAYEELIRYKELADHETLMEALKTAVVEGSVVKAYPEKLVRQARARYETILTAGYSSPDDFLNANGMTRAEFKSGEDAYTSVRAKEELVLAALKEKTGITEAGDEYRNYIAQYGISGDDVDETLMKVILSEMAKQGMIQIRETTR